MREKMAGIDTYARISVDFFQKTAHVATFVP